MVRYQYDECDAIIDTEEDNRIVYDDINSRSGHLIEELMNENAQLRQELKKLREES